MKISILGYSGSGKSTLARTLADRCSADVLHFDRVQFLPGWEVRDFDERMRLTEEFLDTHDAWVIDGTYKRFLLDRRMEESDLIILMLFNRWACFCRTLRRYRKYKNTTRPDMGDGCNEKFDLDFAEWVLWKGRDRKTRAFFADLAEKYSDKVVILKNQKQLDEFTANYP